MGPSGCENISAPMKMEYRRSGFRVGREKPFRLATPGIGRLDPCSRGDLAKLDRSSMKTVPEFLHGHAKLLIRAAPHQEFQNVALDAQHEKDIIWGLLKDDGCAGDGSHGFPEAVQRQHPPLAPAGFRTRTSAPSAKVRLHPRVSSITRNHPAQRFSFHQLAALIRTSKNMSDL